MIKAARVFLLLAFLISGCSGQSLSTPSIGTPTTAANTQLPTETSVEASLVPTAAPVTATVGITPSPTAAAPGNTATPTPGKVSPQSISAGELPFPIRAAFYYPWFPNSWNQSHMDPFTHYHPALGFYSEDDPQVIQNQVAAMKYGKIQVGIASWWGQDHYTNSRIPALLQAGVAANFYWALYVESEGIDDPTPDAIRSDLIYIRDHYASSPVYLKVGGKFVVFAYADANDACGMVDRWKQANTVGAYVVLKVFSGYRNCPNQPDAWHQYAPAGAEKQQGTDSYTISPGFWKATEEQPRLERNLAQWSKAIKDMIASKANFQLVTTFNEWGEGTAVENATEWKSPSGFGAYLDALHTDGATP
jgi:hypothetical protein